VLNSVPGQRAEQATDALLSVRRLSIVRAETNKSSAVWLQKRLRPWGHGGPRVDSLVPQGYPAYARLFHPIRARLDSNIAKVRWSLVASESGRILEPDSRFNEVARWVTSGQRSELPAPYLEPIDGSLDRDDCRALAETLRLFTDTPELCWFGLWEGKSQLFSLSRGAPASLTLEHRKHLMFVGKVAEATTFEEGPWFQSPNIWRPHDRQWFVATEVDGYSTYLGVNTLCLKALSASPYLEVLLTDADARIDPSPYEPRLEA